MENLRIEAEERLGEIEGRISEIQSSAEAAGGATAAQQRQLNQLNDRKAKEEREIARLTEALGD